VGEVTPSAAPAGRRGSVDPAVLAAVLREVCGGGDPVLGGVLVAGADGLVLCAEACGPQVEMLGVMAAAVAGITSQIVGQTGAGEVMACLVEGSAGHVAVFPLRPAMAVVVVGRGGVSTGRFNLAARRVLFRLRQAVPEVPALGPAEGPARRTAHTSGERPARDTGKETVRGSAAKGTTPDTTAADPTATVFEPVNRVPHVRFKLG
jgi:predicted regulator of Ras-like GTPase activity (Roadblock/LC7/MglB family)